MTPKPLREVRRAPPMHWVGDAFAVRTLFSYGDAPDLISPFLLLDYGSPRRFPPSEVPRGVGEHPHRGFETVTIAYQGEISHRDSSGGGGTIGTGDVQWMTAGGGLVHEERFSREFARRGGMLEMVQLWVNLPARHKMTPPRYQAIRAGDVPSVELPRGGTARVIAGELGGRRGPAQTFTPVGLLDLRLPSGRAEIPVPEGHNGLLLVRSGSARADGETASAGELLVFARSGDAVAFDGDGATEALLMHGEPIAEPVVGYGPFVMTSQEEVRQALRDFESGKMGRLG